jgi:hypothetical protein
MSCETIKFRMTQNSVTKTLSIQIYRPYGINNEWMKIDELNEMTVEELRYFTECLIKLFSKKKSN